MYQFVVNAIVIDTGCVSSMRAIVVFIIIVVGIVSMSGIVIVVVSVVDVITRVR